LGRNPVHCTATRLTGGGCKRSSDVPLPMNFRQFPTGLQFFPVTNWVLERMCPMSQVLFTGLLHPENIPSPSRLTSIMCLSFSARDNKSSIHLPQICEINLGVAHVPSVAGEIWAFCQSCVGGRAFHGTACVAPQLLSYPLFSSCRSIDGGLLAPPVEESFDACFCVEGLHIQSKFNNKLLCHFFRQVHACFTKFFCHSFSKIETITGACGVTYGAAVYGLYGYTHPASSLFNSFCALSGRATLSPKFLTSSKSLHCVENVTSGNGPGMPSIQMYGFTVVSL
jgi:hypothetical protein